MIMNFDTAPAAPASTTTAAPAAAAPQPALLPGAPGHGPAALTAAVSSALSLFAQVLDGAAVGTQDAGAGAAPLRQPRKATTTPAPPIIRPMPACQRWPRPSLACL
jgi:flagellar hook-length control protein FliK